MAPRGAEEMHFIKTSLSVRDWRNHRNPTCGPPKEAMGIVAPGFVTVTNTYVFLVLAQRCM